MNLDDLSLELSKSMIKQEEIAKAHVRHLRETCLNIFMQLCNRDHRPRVSVVASGALRSVSANQLKFIKPADQGDETNSAVD